jgi:hypothetical protein
MPFKSEKQRRFLHAKHPEVAKDWEEKYENAEELPAGHYNTHVRLRRGGRWNAHTVNVRKTDKELIQKFLDQGFRIVKPGEEDEEHPRDSMYLKDDPEALKKALAYHRRNVAKLSRKSLADLTDEEYDSLKHSEGELELSEGEENNERYDDRDPVDDDALKRARREEKLMGDIKVDHGGKPKSLKNIKKKINNLDDKIKRMQSFKEFYNGK